MKTESRIDYRFKILYAVGMLMVVCGHCNGGGISLTIGDWFPYAGLHLALFTFCSGYFYKSSAQKQVGSYLLKKFKALILPLYLYNFAYGILVQLLKQAGFTMGGELSAYNLLLAPILDGHQFIYNMGGWFVIPLFLVEACNVLFRKAVNAVWANPPELFFFAVSLGLGLCGNQLACLGYCTGIWLPIVRTLYFMPFYGFGIAYKNVFEKLDTLPNSLYFSAIFAMKLAITWVFGKNLTYTPSWFFDFMEGPIPPIIVGFLGIAFWMRAATILEPVIGRSKWINLIADHTYSIMIHQFLGFLLVKSVFAFFCSQGIAFLDFDLARFRSEI